MARRLLTDPAPQLRYRFIDWLIIIFNLGWLGPAAAWPAAS